MNYINLIGFGVMGRQIAALSNILGYTVYVYNQSGIKKNYQRFELDLKILNRILNTSSKPNIVEINDLSEFNDYLTVESIVELKNEKMNIFEKLKFKNNIYTNSSSIIFDKTSFKVGILHFLNPISLKTVEVFSENNNTKLNEYLEKVKNIGFNIFFLETPNDHFINKVLFLEISSFFYLLEVIKIKYSVLKDIRSQFVASSDLIKTIDLIGVDVCYNIFFNFSKEYDKFRTPKTIIEALEKKILGKKNKTSIGSLDIFKL